MDTTEQAKNAMRNKTLRSGAQRALQWQVQITQDIIFQNDMP